MGGHKNSTFMNDPLARKNSLVKIPFFSVFGNFQKGIKRPESLRTISVKESKPCADTYHILVRVFHTFALRVSPLLLNYNLFSNFIYFLGSVRNSQYPKISAERLIHFVHEFDYQLNYKLFRKEKKTNFHVGLL